jgi:hypothetical protein
MVKEDLFKRVKFITTTAMEAKCMKYLSNKLNVPAERQHKWSASYAHCVRYALNNKRNNVSQDLKAEIKGKKWFKDMKDIEQTTLIKIDAYSYTAILGEPETKEIQAKGMCHHWWREDHYHRRGVYWIVPPELLGQVVREQASEMDRCA